MTIDSLHDDVLLEIFDFYRQSFGDQLSSEIVWNNKNGWFKLAHVCHNWRSVVLASPSRLRLRLYFAHDTPTRAAALRSLSHLPIVVDYSHAVKWNGNTLKRLDSALRHPDRVCRIDIEGSYPDPAIISKALNLHFPALESLVLPCIGYLEPTILAAPLMTSIQSLRHLQLDGLIGHSISSILSVTTSLVDLTLNVNTLDSLMDGASILTYLQHLTHLRNLQVSTWLYSRVKIPPSTTTVLLAELTHFRFKGELSQIEWFLAELVTPSLRELHISIYGYGFGIFHLPNLSKFTRVAGIVFFAARLTISGHTFKISLFAHPLSIDDPPSKTVTLETELRVPVDIAPSPMIASLEDVFLSFSYPTEFDQPSSLDAINLRRFSGEFCNVKVLRLQHGLETIVAHILRLPTVNSPEEQVYPGETTPSGTLSDGIQLTLGIVPLLEDIVVYTRTPDTYISEKERASVLELFEPFTTARRKAGRPVNVFWNTDGEVPRYFMTDLG